MDVNEHDDEYYFYFLNKIYSADHLIFSVLCHGTRQRTLETSFLQNLAPIGQVVAENIFLSWPIRNNNCLWRACFS
jgi:hypothetical protein